MTLQTDNERVLASIRTNIVFEKLIVSVLTVAGVAGAAHFIIGLLARFSGGSFSLEGLVAVLLAAAGFSVFFFIAGFAVSLAIGIPMFRALEKAKLRKTWPYAAAAALCSLAILSAAGAAPSFEAPWRAVYLVPGLAAALLFGRKMRPFWLAAERSDEASPPVTRLH